MVLHDVADGAGLLVHRSPSLNPEILGHRDLHAAHEVAIPDRLEKGVCEAEVEEVLHRLLTEEVIDTEDGALVEDSQQRRVERERRVQIAPERFLDDDARSLRTPRSPELRGNGREHAGRNGQIVQRMVSAAEGLPQLVEGRVVAVVAVDVLQLRDKFAERLLIDAATMLRQAPPSPLPQLLDRPPRLRHPNDRHIQVAALDHRLKSRKDHLVSEITGGAKEDKRIGLNGGHGRCS